VYVCHCEVVSDDSIRIAISAGARDVEEVAALCGAGGACAGCQPTIEELLAEAAAAIRQPALVRARQARHRRDAPVPAFGTHAVAS